MHYFKQQKLKFKPLIDDITINYWSPCVKVQNVTSIKIQSKWALKIREAQSVSQDPFKMGKRKPKPMNG